MNFEPGIVKTVNLDNEQLLVIESRRDARVCVIYRGVCLTGSGLVQCPICSGGSSPRRWRLWILGRLARLRIPTGRTSWKKLEPAQWAPT